MLVRASLESGSALLAYSVGKERTTLFVLTAPAGASGGENPVVALTIPIGEAALRAWIEAWRRLVSGPLPGRRSSVRRGRSIGTSSHRRSRTCAQRAG